MGRYHRMAIYTRGATTPRRATNAERSLCTSLQAGWKHCPTGAFARAHARAHTHLAWHHAYGSPRATLRGFAQEHGLRPSAIATTTTTSAPAPESGHSVAPADENHGAPCGEAGSAFAMDTFTSPLQAMLHEEYMGLRR